MSGRARRWVAYGVAVAALGVVSAFDPGGLRTSVALAHEVERMRGENARLGEENARLAREVHALRTEPAALERAVREELRYVRPGERVYVLDEERHRVAPMGPPTVSAHVCRARNRAESRADVCGRPTSCGP